MGMADTKLVRFSWSSGKAFVSGAEGLRFKSRAGYIGHSVANDSSLLQLFFERIGIARRRNDAKMGPVNSLLASEQYSEYNERFDVIIVVPTF